MPAGNPDGGQWTDAGGGGGAVGSGSDDETLLAQARGRGNVRVGGYTFEATPAQILRLSNATNAANGAVARVREIDPNWRPRSGVYESAEGAISHQRGIEAEANARFNELRRDAIPGTSHNWGVNRLRKELYDRGFLLEAQTRAPGLLYRNAKGEEVRMQRPAKRYRSDTDQKHFNDYYYYRYRPGPSKPWGQHTTVLNTAEE